MEEPIHSLTALFDQLGLDSSEQAINRFVKKNCPLPCATELHNAPFWNVSQAALLKQKLDEDADWVEIVNQLDVMLR